MSNRCSVCMSNISESEYREFSGRCKSEYCQTALQCRRCNKNWIVGKNKSRTICVSCKLGGVPADLWLQDEVAFVSDPPYVPTLRISIPSGLNFQDEATATSHPPYVPVIRISNQVLNLESPFLFEN